MITSHRTLVSYLLDRGLLTLQQCVEEQIRIIPKGRRNLNYAIQLVNGGYFVKQGRFWEQRDATSVLSEAVLLSVFGSDTPLGRAIAPYVPRIALVDPENRILVTLLIDAIGVPQSDAEARARRARSIATALANVQCSSRELASSLLQSGSARGQMPWILSFGERRLDGSNMSAGPKAVRAWIERFDGFGRAVSACRSAYRRECIVNGDAKTQNTLYTRSDGEERCVLVDWEMWDVGDPCWDVAGILQSFLVPQLLAAIRGQPDLPLGSLFDIRGELMSFWLEYKSLCVKHACPQFPDSERTIRFLGCRMIQSAIEMSPSGTLEHPAACVLQASWNLISTPGVYASFLSPATVGK